MHLHIDNLRSGDRNAWKNYRVNQRRTGGAVTHSRNMPSDLKTTSSPRSSRKLNPFRRRGRNGHFKVCIGRGNNISKCTKTNSKRRRKGQEGGLRVNRQEYQEPEHSFGMRHNRVGIHVQQYIFGDRTGQFSKRGSRFSVFMSEIKKIPHPLS